MYVDFAQIIAQSVTHPYFQVSAGAEPESEPEKNGSLSVTTSLYVVMFGIASHFLAKYIK